MDIAENPYISVQMLEERMRDTLPEWGFDRARKSITTWADYRPTDLVCAWDIAAATGVETVLVKDESTRLGLKSFKALGGAYCVQSAVHLWRAQHSNDSGLSGLTVTCVTDGNHGCAVAWGARELGCRCVIYCPDVVSESRENTMRAFGAEVVRVPGTYDQVTIRNAEDAKANGWVIVTDTAGSADLVPVAATVMQGYRLLADEILAQLEEPPTHVFLQAGCGGMAAAVLAHLAARLAVAERPTFITVEPKQAACLLPSIRAGHPVRAEGDLDTIMAGLSVGEVSLAAWNILQSGVQFFTAISDERIPEAMRMFAYPEVTRPAIVAGETGAAALAALLDATMDSPCREKLGLSKRSRVLLINTEGDTDPRLYTELVGTPASEVGTPKNDEC